MDQNTKIYQFKITLKHIKPLIWRQFLVHSHHTLKDLHYVIQILMGWTDSYLNEFIIHNKRYSIPNSIGFTSPSGGYSENRTLKDFKFQKNKKFFYTYDFIAGWDFELRLEKIDVPQKKTLYPVCLSGKGASPKENCEGPHKFQELKDYWPYESRMIMIDFLIALTQKENAKKKIRDVVDIDTLKEAYYWLSIEKYDHKKANKFLRFYAKKDDRWKDAFDESMIS